MGSLALILREQHRLRVFENKEPRMNQERNRKINSRELHSFLVFSK
jgi:hypothetical protein